MRRSVLALAFLCSAGAQAEALALADAVHLAAQRHPDVVAAEKRLAAAEARAEQAHSYRYNPEISYEAQRRRLRDGGRTRDFYLTLAQPLEVGGKRDLRIQKAEAERKAAAAALALARLQAGVRAARAYVQAWHAQQLLRLRKREAALARRLVQAAQKRLALGAGSAVELQAAQGMRTEAERRLLTARESWLAAARALQEAIGADKPVSALTLPKPPPLALPDDPGALARARHPELRHAQALLDAARLQARLTERAWTPDPTLSVMVGREAGDRLAKLGISVALPIWNTRRDAARAAFSEAAAREEELAWLATRLALAAREAARRLQAAARAWQAAPPAPSFALLEKALDAGEIGVASFITLAQQLLRAQEARLGLLRDLWLARARAAQAMGCLTFLLGTCTTEEQP